MQNEAKASSPLLYYLRIGGALTIITAVIAVMLALVNMITVDKIAANKRAEMQKAISAIFTDANASVELAGEWGDEVSAVYEVDAGAIKLGYCAHVVTRGFGGKLEMMVGIKADGTLKGVRIIAHSETPGLGDRVNNEGYLSQYEGLSGSLTLGGEIDAISGATRSSRAVLSGVNAALALGLGGNG